jgi:hypothetical protein
MYSNEHVFTMFHKLKSKIHLLKLPYLKPLVTVAVLAVVINAAHLVQVVHGSVDLALDSLVELLSVHH